MNLVIQSKYNYSIQRYFQINNILFKIFKNELNSIFSFYYHLHYI